MYNEKPVYAQLVNNKLQILKQAPWLGIQYSEVELIDTTGVKFLHPSEPTVIIGLSKSYKQNWKDRSPFRNVRWFIKPVASAADPGDEIPIPLSLTSLKVEVELVIVIGKEIKNADETTAQNSIFGYTVGNDVVGTTDSYYKISGDDMTENDPLLAPGLKIGDRFAPYGPFIYKNYQWKNKMRSLIIYDINGNEKANYENSTNDLLYPPAKIVSDLSSVLTLHPGDVIFTGTSQSFVVRAGDRIVFGLEGMRSFENTIVKYNKPKNEK
ncbi:MAG: fumarylacetoacetate hydrolase family protein [Ginsengibacter sp.]